MKQRLGIIILFTLLLVGFIINWGHNYYKGLEEAYTPIIKPQEIPVIPSENGVFLRAEQALEYLKMPIDSDHERTLATYYNNRAFYGAPPSIPHPVEKNKSLGGKECLQCHQNGGFVDKWKAYTPVVPHPEMINCKQCHVPQEISSNFKTNNFTKFEAPKVGVNAAFDGAPPTIPHQLQMRENCLSCHAGPAAPKEIRVTHPERINCRQCHVPSVNTSSYTATLEFIRTNLNTNENK